MTAFSILVVYVASFFDLLHPIGGCKAPFDLENAIWDCGSDRWCLL